MRDSGGGNAGEKKVRGVKNKCLRKGVTGRRGGGGSNAAQVRVQEREASRGGSGWWADVGVRTELNPGQRSEVQACWSVRQS